MMKRQVLILERDDESSQRLVRLFRAAGVTHICVVPSMREACLALTQESCDLALIPQARAIHQVRTMRAIVPDLPIILVADESERPIPEDTLSKTLGLYSMAQLGMSLPKLLAAAWTRERPVTPKVQRREKTTGAKSVILDALRSACAEVGWGEQVAQVVLAVQGHLVAYCGDDEARASEVAAEAWRAMAASNRTTHVQYRRFGTPPVAAMLYSQPVSGALLTIITGCQTPVYVARRWAQRLIGLLAEQSALPGPARLPVLEAEPDGDGQADEHTVTLAWRPVERLSKEIRAFVYHTIQELARDNLCILSYLSVEETLVHLVVTCPPGRSTVWAAKQFKEGTERAVRLEYRLPDALWQRGYLVADPVDPATPAALELFVDRADFPEK